MPWMLVVPATPTISGQSHVTVLKLRDLPISVQQRIRSKRQRASCDLDARECNFIKVSL
jgi:hypothetical protein